MAVETSPRNQSGDFKFNRRAWSSSTVQNYLPSYNTQTATTVDYSKAMFMWQADHEVSWVETEIKHLLVATPKNLQKITCCCVKQQFLKQLLFSTAHLKTQQVLRRTALAQNQRAALKNTGDWWVSVAGIPFIVFMKRLRTDLAGKWEECEVAYFTS